jgi:hypothetical protein
MPAGLRINEHLPYPAPGIRRDVKVGGANST